MLGGYKVRIKKGTRVSGYQGIRVLHLKGACWAEAWYGGENGISK